MMWLVWTSLQWADFQKCRSCCFICFFLSCVKTQNWCVPKRRYTRCKIKVSCPCPLKNSSKVKTSLISTVGSVLTFQRPLTLTLQLPALTVPVSPLTANGAGFSLTSHLVFTINYESGEKSNPRESLRYTFEPRSVNDTVYFPSVGQSDLFLFSVVKGQLTISEKNV